jgi:hypothetical protein
MKLLLSEILEKANKATTNEERVAILKQHETPALRGFMRINFDHTVNMGLPDGVPPYKKPDNPIGYDHVLLENEYKKFYIWLDVNTKLSKIKKEQLFIQLLESLHNSESELLCEIKDQILDQRLTNLNFDFVKSVFPNSLPENDMRVKKIVSQPIVDIVQPEVQTKVEVEPPVKKGRGRPRKNPV